jgi:hypothetical protein
LKTVAIMGKLLLAFAAGMAVTSLAFQLFDRAPSEFSVERSEGVQSRSPLSPSLNRDGISLSERPVTLEAEPMSVSSGKNFSRLGLPEELTQFGRGLTGPAAPPDLLSTWTDEELRALYRRADEMANPASQMYQARFVRGLAEKELRNRRISTQELDGPPADFPIALPPEFGFLSEESNPYHTMLERDEIDPNWSRQMDVQLHSFFASHPENIAAYGFPTVNCRTMGCEVAFASYALNAEQAELKVEQFPDAVSGIFSQPWAATLTRQSTPSPDARYGDDGAQTFLWYIWR